MSTNVDTLNIVEENTKIENEYHLKTFDTIQNLSPEELAKLREIDNLSDYDE